ETLRRNIQSALQKAEETAQIAIGLDSRNAIAYSALASIQLRRRNYLEAEDLFSHGLALDPNDPDVLQAYGVMLASVGRTKEYLDNARMLVVLEPLVPTYRLSLALAMEVNGPSAATIPMLEALQKEATQVFVRNTVLAYGYAELGRYGEAADLLLA